jgi:hypothetical protein
MKTQDRPLSFTGSAFMPVYLPHRQSHFRVYRGELSVSHAGSTRRFIGSLEFRLGDRPGLYMQVYPGDSWLEGALASGEAEVTPLDTSLNPSMPTWHVNDPVLLPWEGTQHRIGNLTAGELAKAKRFVIHASTPLAGQPFPLASDDDAAERELRLNLPGWRLRLTDPDECRYGMDFPFYIEAVPDAWPVTEEAIERLQWRLFVMLSFAAGTEAGLPLVAGVDDAGDVVWGDWSTPRTGSGQWRWCPDQLVNDALPALAQGFSQLANDPTMEKVTDRAINLYLTANGKQPVDARIPLACAALELLAWGILQTQQWVTTDALAKLTAAASIRLLLQWANVDIAVPPTFAALEARRRSLGQADLAAPDALVKIRNDLVHPPKRLTQLEWPSSEEMQQAWRVSMEYLELVILRAVNYQKHYLPRAQLTSRWVTDTELVPWAR